MDNEGNPNVWISFAIRVRTILLGSGVPLKNVSTRLGHSSASITANIYAHALESVDRQAADKLDLIIEKGTGISLRSI